MNDPSSLGGPGAILRHELEALREQWWWFLLLGIGLVVLGSLSLGMSLIMTVTAVVLFGVFLLIGGIGQMIGAFWAGRWSGFLLSVLVGLLYVVTGWVMIDDPLKGAAGLTLLIAAMLIVGGIFRIVAALVLRFHHWGWPLLNGVISLMLGVMIYKQWPSSSLWVIGLFVGIEMIFNGWSWVMLAIGLKSLPKA